MTSLLSTFVFLFTLLNIPLPPVYISSFEELITTTTKMLAAINYSLDFKSHPNQNFYSKFEISPTYDFIIVGAGTAGCVIANRLSENGLYKVLLLEAGGDPISLNYIPLLWQMGNLGQNETDWTYKSVPLANSAFGTENNMIQIPRGKSLGGSSNLNGMVYIRGNPNDYNNWAHLTGDPQWNYQNVLVYFKKSENYKGNFFNPLYHGTSGPMSVTSFNYAPLVEEWMEAAKEFGLSNSDPNGIQTSTFVPIDATVRNGERESSFTAFLEPALNRPNLHVIRYAHVTKINLDSSNKARGVTYQRNGEIFEVLASKEVIISAGAINTPQLLMLSGIGPVEHLKSLGIKPKVNLPGVGKNLQDHVLSFIGPFILNDTVSYFPSKNLTNDAVIDYVYNRKGPLSTNGNSGIGFFSTSDPPNPSWPNIATFKSSLGIDESYSSDFDKIVGLRPGTVASYVNGFNNRDAVTLFMNLGRPKSRGSITLKTNNPFDKPLIDLNYYDEPEDIKAMVEGFKFLVKLFEKSSAWQKYNATLIPNHIPGCEAFALRSDEYYECYLRTVTGSTWHQCCTAKMGTFKDPMTVVNSHLRVRDVQNLRVADASVMPIITNGNINAAVTMIGEKASDLILQDWMDPSRFHSLFFNPNGLFPSIPFPFQSFSNYFSSNSKTHHHLPAY